ncbi:MULTISPECIES: hypothetical protein [Clostridium]|uniref:hypothetical protein n=1 Tax=Clostridium TaxID=1485 RepID=UPI00077307BC|nr:MULTISPECIES: hypothetical protein [Clostridium]AUM96147.1 hypothetical protein RSJ11_13700 [Clostridium sporogenes]AVQ53598.1 hypothetical protein C7M59_12315 [Clostridium botulinum]
MLIDLDKYINRTIDFKINGELIKVQELTPSLFKKVSKYEMTEDPEKIYEKQVELVTEMLNRNTSGKKFTTKDLEKLPQSAVNKIYISIVSFTKEPLEDPN